MADDDNGNGRTMSETEDLLRRGRKALTGIAGDKEQTDAMRGLARKARQSLNNVIVELSGE